MTGSEQGGNKHMGSGMLNAPKKSNGVGGVVTGAGWRGGQERGPSDPGPRGYAGTMAKA